MQKSKCFFFVCFLQKGERGIEGAAAQSDSPVDCRDRGRPRRAVRAASRSPSSPPEKRHLRPAGAFVRYFTHSTVLPMFEKKTTQKENEVRKHGGTVS